MAAPEHTVAVLPPIEGLTAVRRRFLEAAVRVFGNRGFHAVSVKDLMAEIGQQAGGFYFHSPSKQDLLLELVELGTHHHRTRVRRALLDAGTDPADQLRAVVAAHVRAHLEHPDLARLVTRELRSLTDDQRDRVADAHRETAQIVQDVLERGMAAGAFHVGSPALLVLAIASMGVRACEWWGPDEPFTLDEVVEQYAEYAVKLAR